MSRSQEDAIKRLQGAAQKQAQRNEAEKRRLDETEQRLQKLRKMKPNPPSFANRKTSPPPKKVLLRVKVEVYPGKYANS